MTVDIKITGLDQALAAISSLSERRLHAATATALTRTAVKVRDVVRQKETLYNALALHDASDEALLDAMLANPILINRPIVVTPRGVKLCRPSESVLDLLHAHRTALCAM